MPIPAIVMPKASPRFSSNQLATLFAYPNGPWPDPAIPAIAYNARNMGRELGLVAINATLAPNATIAGINTRRTPQRSIRTPTMGTVSAEHNPAAAPAREIFARSQPNSSLIGPMNSPSVKSITGPWATNIAIVAPKTIHHLFAAPDEFFIGVPP